MSINAGVGLLLFRDCVIHAPVKVRFVEAITGVFEVIGIALVLRKDKAVQGYG